MLLLVQVLLYEQEVNREEHHWRKKISPRIIQQYLDEETIRMRNEKGDDPRS